MSSALDLIRGPIEVVGCHAEGEVGDVIVGGVEPPPGVTLWDQSRWIHQDGTLRRHVLNEPRGGVFRHVNLIVPPVQPAADVGFIIMEPEHTPPMSGSNTMCVATVVLETGIVPMREPVTTLTLEAPAGLVEVQAACHGGKVTSVQLRNVASFAVQRDVELSIPGIGPVRVDTAWGGDSFVLVDAADLGVTIEPGNGAELARLGASVTAAANQQLGFSHPTLDWNHVSFCQIAGPLRQVNEQRFEMTNTVVIDPGKLDRSPTGTGVSARLGLLHAQGLAPVGTELDMRSIIGSRFTGTVAAETMVADHVAVVPLIEGRAWRTGRTVFELDPDDPWPLGYRVGDTWPTRPHG